MEGQEGAQQPQVVLANKLFRLKHPDVQDIEKVQLKEEVFTHVKDNGSFLTPIRLISLSSFDCQFSQSVSHSSHSSGADMVPLYETLVTDSVLDRDRSLLDSMRAKLDEELKKLDDK